MSAFNDEDTISPTSNTMRDDLEKKMHASQIGDQIPNSMLEELAPNGEGEYIRDKINNMPADEAIAIVEESSNSSDDGTSQQTCAPVWSASCWAQTVR